MISVGGSMVEEFTFTKHRVAPTSECKTAWKDKSAFAFVDEGIKECSFGALKNVVLKETNFKDLCTPETDRRNKGNPKCIVYDGKLNVNLKKLYKYGERGSGISTQGDVQDFYKLRDYHCETQTLFEDPQFPADHSSLSFSGRSSKYDGITWKRPHQICDDPRLFVEGFSRFDVQQGELGDCWLLAAVANLTLHHNLFFQIVPADQSFDEQYAGIFHFRFWQYGRWIDVVIDDLLPTRYGELVFLSSSEKNEFWSALLEKAYAKLHGSYEAIEGGNTCEAMEDFTGGVSEMYVTEEAPPNLFKIIKNAYERGSLIGLAIEPDPHIVEAKTPQGLVKGHAYSCTKVVYLNISTPRVSGKIALLRIRNPWGNDTEWNGPWSDQSPEWSLIPEDEKEHIGLNFDNDGEFWMSFQDVLKYFNRVELCNLNPDSLEEGEAPKRWELSMYEGAWVQGVTAGGCRNYLDTFVRNPQYNITLTEPDEDDDKCTVIVSLTQKNRRKLKNVGADHLTIGFVLYYIHDPDRAPRPLDKNYFRHNRIVGKSPTFVNLREVTCRFTVPPGTYCIIPSTFEPDEEGEFLLRVFSENKNNLVYVSQHGEDEPPQYKPPSPPPRNPRSINSGFNFGGFNFSDFPSLPFFGNTRFDFSFQSPNSGASAPPAQQGQAPPYPTNPGYPQSGYPGGQPPYPGGGQPAYPGGQPPYPTHNPFPQQGQPYPGQGAPPYPPQQHYQQPPPYPSAGYPPYNRPPYPPPGGGYPPYPRY